MQAASQSEDTPAEEFAEPVAQIEDDEIAGWIAELDSEEPVIPSTEPTEDAAVEPVEGFEDTDAAMAWLESLAAKQGVSKTNYSPAPKSAAIRPMSRCSRGE